MTFWTCSSFPCFVPDSEAQSYSLCLRPCITEMYNRFNFLWGISSEERELLYSGLLRSGNYAVVISGQEVTTSRCVITQKSQVLSYFAAKDRLTQFFRCVRKISKNDQWLRLTCWLLRASAWTTSAANGRIFMIFYIRVFLKKYVYKIHFTLKSENNNWKFTLRPMYIHISLIFLE